MLVCHAVNIPAKVGEKVRFKPYRKFFKHTQPGVTSTSGTNPANIQPLFTNKKFRNSYTLETQVGMYVQYMKLLW
jgi:hypothetical protein